MRVPIEEIIVGDRRREDMGDITGLAESIRQFGLLHPIVVDEQKRLVAGGRRLTACKSLGWQEVEVTFLGELSEDELSEIELEENLQRKDLTDAERSKKIKRLVDLAKQIIKKENQSNRGSQIQQSNSFAHGGQNSKPAIGRPPKEEVSLQEISERVGIPRTTLQRAINHDQVLEKYSVLETLPQVKAIETAKQLDTMPPEVVPKAIEIIEAKGDISFMQDPNYVPPLERVKRNPVHRLHNIFYKFSVIVNGVTQWGGIESEIKNMNFSDIIYVTESLQKIRDKIDSWIKILEPEVSKQKQVRRVK